MPNLVLLSQSAQFGQILGLSSATSIFVHNFQKVVALNECVPMQRLSSTFTMLLHGSKEAKMPSFITIAICGGFDPKMS